MFTVIDFGVSAFPAAKIAALASFDPEGPKLDVAGSTRLPLLVSRAYGNSYSSRSRLFPVSYCVYKVVEPCCH